MNPLHGLKKHRHEGELRLSAGLRARLEPLLDAVEILSPTSFRFAGGAPVVLGALAPRTAATTPGGVQPLVEALWPVLYQHGYSHRFEGTPLPPPTPEQALAAIQLDQDFIARVSTANESRQSWDPQWRVYQLGTGGTLHVQKGEVYRLVMPGEYACLSGPGRLPRVGDTVELLVHRESRALQAGFYHLFSETISSEFDDADLGRVYFNARPERVPWLVGLISRELNHYRVPFRMKCVSNPAAYGRLDSAVLYLGKRFIPVVLRLLSKHEAELPGALSADVPLFTKQVAHGVGVADDPGSAESFGMNRCRLMSQALLDAWQRGQHTHEERMQALADRFVQAGLCLERPHLNEGMVDLYQWPQGQEAVS